MVKVRLFFSGNNGSRKRTLSLSQLSQNVFRLRFWLWHGSCMLIQQPSIIPERLFTADSRTETDACYDSRNPADFRPGIGADGPAPEQMETLAKKMATAARLYFLVAD